MTRTTTYFAAASDTSLRSICEALQTHFGLPDFVIQNHDTWQYAVAKTINIGFNVTKDDNQSTIETWMEHCPTGVNFQIIAEYDVEPDKLADVLTRLLGTEPIRYRTDSA